MVLLKSTDIPTGHPAPDFSLPSVEGKAYSLKDFQGSKGLVVMFICNHCPYVIAVEDRIVALAKKYSPKGISFVGICSNDPTDYPDDRPEKLKERWQKKNYGFPYLIDESQEVAKVYGAVCTPELYVFDKEHRLYYHGRIDDNWQDEALVKHPEMAEAFESLLKGEEPPSLQHPSMGCSIKWKK